MKIYALLIVTEYIIDTEDKRIERIIRMTRKGLAFFTGYGREEKVFNSIQIWENERYEYLFAQSNIS